jgi:hypothetical protein
MKKLFLSTILSVLIAALSLAADTNKKNPTAVNNSTSHYESGENVNSAIISSFASRFDRAENVSWTSTEGFVKASFTLGNKSMAAYYEKDASFIGTSSLITLDQLPIRAKRSFAKRYSDYTIKDAIRFDASDETAYYVTAENEARSLILKVSAQGSVSIFFKSVRKKD